MKGKTWRTQRSTSAFTRRTILRGAAIGGAGFFGAALLGCGEDDSPAGASETTGLSSGATVTPSTPGPDERRHGGTLRVGYDRDIPRLGPRDGSGAYEQDFFMVSGDSYLYLNNDGRTFDLDKSLFEEWEFVDDVTLSIRLRQGVTFHDGSPLTVEAVREHLEFMSDPDQSESTYVVLMSALESIDWH